MATAATATTGVLVGFRVNVDGSFQDVEIPADRDGTHVEGLNRAIGSHTFDVVGLPNGVDVFVDDEGLYTAEHNPVLSAMVAHLTGAPRGYQLHGAGVFLGVNENTGDTLTMTPTQRAEVATTWLIHVPMSLV